MMLLSQTLSHFLVGYLVLCLRLLSKGQIPCPSILVQVQLSQKAPDYNSNDDKRSTMDEEEGWTMVTRKRWKKKRAFPLHLITQESRRAQNQIQPW